MLESGDGREDVNFEMRQVEHWDSFGGGQSAEILENLKVNMTAGKRQQNNSEGCSVHHGPLLAGLTVESVSKPCRKRGDDVKDDNKEGQERIVGDNKI